MAFTKLQAEGINLADTFAFTGTVSGVGGGKMPGFGAVLPQSDIELVIDYLRGLTPDA